MVPYLDIPTLRLGPLSIQPFGLLVCIGIVVGYFCAKRRTIQVGLDPKVLRQLVRLCVVFGLFGAHLVHLIAYHPEELASSPWVIFKVWAGMSSYGGFLSAAAACAIYLRKSRIPFLPYADVMLFGLLPGWFFGRMGCSTAHDHPGCLSDFWLAVKFPNGPRHDLGLYEFLLCFLWIPMIHWLGRKKQIDDPPRGTILHAVLVAYSVPRFFLDFLRASDLAYRDVRYFGLTPAQYACLACTLIGLRFLLKTKTTRSA